MAFPFGEWVVDVTVHWPVETFNAVQVTLLPATVVEPF